MGTAILVGLLKASLTSPPMYGRYCATVNTKESADRLEALLEPYKGNADIEVTYEGDTGSLEVVRNCDVVMLGCKPYLAAEILGQPGFFESLEDKLLMSVVGGLTREALLAKNKDRALNLESSQYEGSVYEY